MKAIEELILLLKSAFPGVQIRQLQTTSPGDDSGLWFVRHPSSNVEVNVESHDGEYPFLIENSRDDSRLTVSTPAVSIQAIGSALGLRLDHNVDATSVTLEDGSIRAWIEQETIHLIARESASNDPVELTAASARRLAQVLIGMAGKLDE